METVKKYELTNDTITFRGRTLFRIRALSNFPLLTFSLVKKGDLGGYIEKEANLSHHGNAWVDCEAKVCNNAVVKDNAVVCGSAEIFDDAEISDDAIVYEKAQIYDKAKAYGVAEVYGNAEVCGNSLICGKALVYGDAKVYGNSLIYGNAKVYGNSLIYDNAGVFGDAEVFGNSNIYGNAEVYGNSNICGIAIIHGSASIKTNNDYITVTGFGSANRTTTFFRTSDNNIFVKCGCFSGNLAEFEEKVKETHKDTKYAKEYLAMVQAVKIHFE